jgi:hypothetical protein
MGSCWRIFLHKVRLWEPRGAASRANPREPLPNHHSFTPTFGTSVPPVRGITLTKAKDLPSDLASITRIDRDFGRHRGSVDSPLVSRTNPSPQKDLVKDCKCGTTERRRFCKQYCNTDDPSIWLTITWIPCPVHPCVHSPHKESEGARLGLVLPQKSPWTMRKPRASALCMLRCGPTQRLGRSIRTVDPAPMTHYLTRYIVLWLPEVGNIGLGQIISHRISIRSTERTARCRG